MSYCRKNGTDSDLYIVKTNGGKENITCFGCCLTTEFLNRSFSSPQEVLDHLLDHREMNHKIPSRVNAVEA